MRDRKSKPSEYEYKDIDKYYYASDKIMMTNKVVIEVSKLSHLPKAIEYANGDLAKRWSILGFDKFYEGIKDIKDGTSAKKLTIDYNLDDYECTLCAEEEQEKKQKPKKPPTPLKNRLKNIR